MARPLLPSVSILKVLIPSGQRAKWVLVVALGIALAIAESIAALSIAVLIETMTSDGSSIEMPVVGDIAGYLPGETPAAKLWYLAGGMAVFFVLKGVLTFGQTYVQERVAENTGARVGTRLFTGYLKMPYSFHIRHSSSELMRNASWAADEVVRNFLKPIAKIVTQVTMLLFLVGVLVAAAPQATLVTVAVLVPVTLIVVRLVKPSLERLGKQAKGAAERALRSLQQGLHGIRDVKVLRREQYFGREYRTISFQFARYKYSHPTISEIPRLSVETLLVLAILGFVGLSGGVTDEASVAILGMFAYAGLRLMPAMSAIVAAVNRIRYGYPVSETLVDELVMIGEQEGLPSTPVDYVLEFTDRLQLTHVAFEYEAGRPVLKDINITIKRGENIGIVGETGAGKSTLLDLILGLLTPTEGTVTVDGEDMQGISSAWHSILGLVPQTTYLLDDTIKRNIAFGIPDPDIDEKAVEEAVLLARLGGFVDALPDRLETVVGERGVKLSGGQRQRVAIARALYQKPQVLILDEGTASLDNVTEAEVMKSIDPLRGEMTIIMVAHRLTTVKNCDRILLVSGGELADEGTFDDLRKRNLEFRKMTG
jgi:ATP-binding cassette subfamily C protein